MRLHNSEQEIWRTVFGEKEIQRLWHRYSASRGRGLGESFASGDTEILRERRGATRVPGMEGRAKQQGQVKL